MSRTGASWLISATLLFGALVVTSPAIGSTDTVGAGSLDRPVGTKAQTGGALNRTKWTVQVGDTITGKIKNVTDSNLAGATEADVFIKSSARGNVTVRGTKSGTTITFTWHVPTSACDTMVVAYGPVGSHSMGNNTNNGIIRQLFNPQGGLAVAGFA
ncbi:MAG TPA: hypothetical protein VH420_09890, partial [Gaiellaceae bacterium]